MLKRRVFFLLLRCLCLLALLCGALTCSAAEPQKMLSVPTAKFNKLSTNNKTLTTKLAELNRELTKLDNQSMELQAQLQKANAELEQSKKELLIANQSLQNVESLQQKTSESLRSFKVQRELENEKHHDREQKLKWQRNLYALLTIIICAGR